MNLVRFRLFHDDDDDSGLKLKQQSYPIWLMVYIAWPSVTAAHSRHTRSFNEKDVKRAGWIWDAFRRLLTRFHRTSTYQILTKETNGHDLRLQISEISYLFVVTCEFSYAVAVLSIEISIPFFISYIYVYTWISDRDTRSNPVRCQTRRKARYVVGPEIVFLKFRIEDEERYIQLVLNWQSLLG